MTSVALVFIVTGARFVTASKQRSLAAEVRSVRGSVQYDGQWIDSAYLKTRNGWLVPSWLVHSLGIDFFAVITDVSFRRGNPGYSELADVDLPGVTFLRVCSDRVGDVDVAWVCRQRSLEVLWLERTKISAAALSELGALPNLETLILFDVPAEYDVSELANLSNLNQLTFRRSSLPKRAVEELRRILPKCQIDHR
jgi:hypothetical protein